jgi:hypothetical protein
MEKSESIKALSAAMVKFTGMMTKVKKDATNPFFKNKYASLSNIIEATQKPLSECGLAVLQLPAGENLLTTMLVHETGEYIAETYTMKPAKSDPQGIGSAITYQRRYALGAILNLNIDDDDDGNTASGNGAAKTVSPHGKTPLRESTDAYRKAIDFIAKGGTYTDIEKKYSVSDKVRESINAAVAAQTQKTEVL